MFETADDGDRWRALQAPVPGGGASGALLVDGDGRLLAGSHSGVWEWNAAGQQWQSRSGAAATTPRPRAVRALVRDARGVLFAASETDGILASFDDGLT